ncbi:hypothetical protein AQUCO_05700036v1 [Aquilegia coerulea]|uniref:Uncharacterized protein n=1 Tax=Aquilegia coerulea TaxID=218851 RepID=A0A2G5CFG5_AQUCA|nr:hypothetical protein AQUCO_05700036v1 [Aquilegia coerulea]
MNPVANPQVGTLVPNDHGRVHGSGSTVSQIIDLTGEDDENLVENQAVAAFVEPSNVRPNSISTKSKRRVI